MIGEQNEMRVFNNAETNDMLNKCYASSDNFKERRNGSRVLYIFFSSQGLWNRSDPATFENRVNRDDHYDFYNVTQTEFFARKKYDQLFVRDIYLSWYAYGISEKVPTQAALTDFLSEKASAYDEVVTVGSSAGGYAAILFGAKIGADRIFVFGPQNDLAGHLEFYKNSDMYSYFDVNSGRVVPDLTEIISSYKGKLYYFYADKAKVDLFQYSRVKDATNLIAFPITSEEHGRTLLAENMMDVICSKDKKLMKLSNSIRKNGISTVAFCLRSAGPFRFVAIMMRKVYRTIFSKGHIM